MNQTTDGVFSSPEACLVVQRLAQIQGLRASVRDLPREALRCYPVPVVHEAQVFLAVPFCLRQGQPPAPPRIGAPGWILYLDMATGTKASSQRTADDPTIMLGEHRLEPPMTMAQFQQTERAMLEAMDPLLRAWAMSSTDPTPGAQAAASAAKARFAALWRHLAHKPIATHYRALNPSWFQWVGL